LPFAYHFPFEKLIGDPEALFEVNSSCSAVNPELEGIKDFID